MACAVPVLGWAAEAAMPGATEKAEAQVQAQAQAPAQAEPATGWRTEIAQTIERVTAIGDDTARWIDRELGQERVVKGAAYCADAVHETIQPLADGNRIVNRRSTRLCRDGEGRTRQEVVGGDGRRTIYLRDPVAQESWVLDPERKTARRSVRMVVTQAAGQAGAEAQAWRDHAERLREWARQLADRARGSSATPSTPPALSTPPTPPTPTTPSTPRAAGSLPPPAAAASPTPAGPAGTASAAAAAPWPVIVSRTESRSTDGSRHDVEVQVLRVPRDAMATLPTAPVPPVPPMPGGDGWAPPAPVGAGALRLAPRGPGVTQALPGREIEGLKANGERTTWTIEAGKLGNEKPIVITREVWRSPELMLTVQSREFDPRSGETLYQLRNLVRGEPDPALFRVPADHARGRERAPSAAPSAPARG